MKKNYSIKAKDYHCWNARQGAVHLQLQFIYFIFFYSDIFNLKASDWHCPRAHNSAGSTSLPMKEGDIKLPTIIFTIHQKPTFPIYSFIQPLNQSSRECKLYLHPKSIMWWAKILNQSCTAHGSIYGCFNHPWEGIKKTLLLSHINSSAGIQLNTGKSIGGDIAEKPGEMMVKTPSISVTSIIDNCIKATIWKNTFSTQL